MVNYSGTRAIPRLDLGLAFMEWMEQKGDFIGRDILAPLPVAEQAASFSRLTAESMLSSADVNRAPRGGYNRVEFGATDDEYSTKEYGLEGVVDDRERKIYQSDFDHEMATLQQVGLRIKRAQEIRIAAAVFNTTTWTGTPLYTDVSSAPWDTANSAVIKPVTNAIEKVRQNSGLKANALVLAKSQLDNLLSNDEIIARFPGAPLVTRAMLEAALGPIFGLERLIVGGAVKNTAKEGQAKSLSDIWTDDYAMICVVANSGDPINTPCIGRSIRWEPESAEDLVVEQYREEQSRGDVVRARHDVDEKIMLVEAGHLLKID